MDSISLNLYYAASRGWVLGRVKKYLRCLPGEDSSEKVVVFDAPLALAKAA